MNKLVIIGGGPAGLSAALYASRSGLSPLVFAGSPPGGQLMLTAEVENFPGQESVLGPDLISRLRKQAEKFGAKIVNENIQKIDLGTPIKLFYGDAVVEAKTIIIATGAKAIWLGLRSEKRLRGRGVSACATCDGFFFRDKVVGVVGGGDTAMEESLTLTKFAKKIYLIHRRDSLRASKIMQKKILNNPKIEIIWNTSVKEVLGKNKVEGVKLLTNFPEKKTSKIKSLGLDGLFIAIGHRPDTSLFKDKIELDKKGFIITAERFMEEYSKLKIGGKRYKTKIENLKLEKMGNKFNLDYLSITSVPGIFAAGDCVDYRYQQAVVAAANGVRATLDLEKWMERNQDKLL